MTRYGFAEIQPEMADGAGVPESADIMDDMNTGVERFLGGAARRNPMGRKRIG
jgi:hypothetical protein